MQIEPAGLSTGRRYYLMISCIIPRPIAWVGTYNDNGGNSLAPFSFFNGFSASPPILGIGFAPHDDKGEKDTLRNIRRSGVLSVSIPEAGQVEQVDATGDDLAYGYDEFTHAGLSAVACETIAAPRVQECRVCLECGVYQIVPLGTQGNTLVLAEVKLLHIADTLVDDYGCVDGLKFKPLARMGGRSYAPVGDVFTLDRQGTI